VSIAVEGMPALGLKRYAEICGVTLARAHAKSGDAATISGYLGSADTFDQAIGTSRWLTRTRRCATMRRWWRR
jgi:hypothetical protein